MRGRGAVHAFGGRALLFCVVVATQMSVAQSIQAPLDSSISLSACPADLCTKSMRCDTGMVSKMVPTPDRPCRCVCVPAGGNDEKKNTTATPGDKGETVKHHGSATAGHAAAQKDDSPTAAHHAAKAEKDQFATAKGDSTLSVTPSGAIHLQHVVVGNDGTLHASLPQTALESFLEAADATKKRPSSWPTSEGCPVVYSNGVGGGSDVHTITLRTCMIGGANAGALHCPYDPNDGTKLTHPDAKCTATLNVHTNGWPTESINLMSATPSHSGSKPSHILVASGRFPNFAESQNEVTIPLIDSWLELRDSFKDESKVAFIADTVLVTTAVDGSSGTPSATLDNLKRFAQISSWDDLKGSTVQSMYTGLPGLDIYSMSQTALAKDAAADDERKRLTRFQDSLWGRVGLQGLKSQKAASGKKVLWMRRTTDRVVLNEEEVVEAAYKAGASNVTVISCGEQPVKNTILDIHSADVVFGVHGADFANTAHLPSPSKKRVVTAQFIHCGNPGLLNNAKTAPTGQWLGGYALLLGQPYLETYMDSYMDCKDKSKTYSVDNRANFSIGNLPKVQKFFEKAFEILADKSETGITKFL